MADLREKSGHRKESESMSEMLDGIIEWTGAYIAFGVMLLGFVGSLMLAILFAALALRGAWRWLKRHTWPSMLLRIERKALR
jgi:hypothetical protein